MNSPILVVGGRLLLPLTVAFSLYLLWRGHNEPGGGFVGGPIAAAGCTLHALANGRDALTRLIRVTPKAIAGTGLLLALGSGIPALVSGTPFLTHRWAFVGDFAIGTALVFDIGVYLTVVGAVLTFFDFYMEA
jgi:multicomponent Na+:H+ antiporter subunit B